MLESVELGEYRLGNLFNKKTVKGIPKSQENLIENNRGFHIFGQNIQYQYPQKFLNDPKYLQKVSADEPILAYTSSVGEIGIIKESFYRTGDNGAFQGLFSKEHKFSFNELQFMLPILKKHFNTYSYNTSMANIINLKISLPTKNGSIDFDFMERFIAELEEERIRLP